MTEHLSLFEEMDHAADALRRDNPELRDALVDELQMTFREIQKRREPDLSTAEWIELFRLWGYGYAARRARERDEAIAQMLATIDDYAQTNPPAAPFCCPCGAETSDPFDPSWVAIHQPHCQQAGEERIAREWQARRGHA